MSRLLFFLLFSAGLFTSAEGQTAFRNFIVKENLLKNQQLAVIAATVTDVPDATYNGTLHFNVNGFSRELQFHDGVAVLKERIEKSMFVYLKYDGAEPVSKLYYVRVSDTDVTPVYISWIALLIIPGLIILIPLLFRKLIIYAIVALLIWLYFSGSHGLDVPMFFRTVFDGVAHLF